MEAFPQEISVNLLLAMNSSLPAHEQTMNKQLPDNHKTINRHLTDK